jgi:hypothetical protein
LRNNLIEDLNGNTWGGDGRSLQVLNGVHHLTVEHNTFINPLGGTFVNADGPNFPNENFIYRNNITSNGVYGLHGSGKGIGNPALNFYFPGAQFHHNVLTDGKASNGGTASNYPAENYFPGPMADIGFLAFNLGIGGDYRLMPGSTFSGAGSDDLDIGADMEALKEATEGVLSGINEVCETQTTQTGHDVFQTKISDRLPRPNPGNDYVLIPIPPIQKSSAVMLNPDGIILKTVKISQQHEGWVFDTSTLCKGVYIIELQTEGKVYRFKWVKME